MTSRRNSKHHVQCPWMQSLYTEINIFVRNFDDIEQSVPLLQKNLATDMTLHDSMGTDGNLSHSLACLSVCPSIRHTLVIC